MWIRKQKVLLFKVLFHQINQYLIDLITGHYPESLCPTHGDRLLGLSVGFCLYSSWFSGLCYVWALTPTPHPPSPPCWTSSLLFWVHNPTFTLSLMGSSCCRTNWKHLNCYFHGFETFYFCWKRDKVVLLWIFKKNDNNKTFLLIRTSNGMKKYSRAFICFQFSLKR